MLQELSEHRTSQPRTEWSCLACTLLNEGGFSHGAAQEPRVHSADQQAAAVHGSATARPTLALCEAGKVAPGGALYALSGAGLPYLQGGPAQWWHGAWALRL